MSRFRPRSLFWMFAGAFLAVLVVAAVLQVAMVYAIVGPLASRFTRSQAELIARRAADRIAESGGTESLDLRALLGELGLEERRFLLVYRGEDGRVSSVPPMPARMLTRFLEEEPPGSEVRGRSGDRQSGDRPLGDLPPGARRPGMRRPGDGPPGMRGGSPPHPGPGGRFDPRRAARLAEQRVAVAGRALGTVFVYGPERRLAQLPVLLPRPLLLFLPVALVVAGIAGLILFRLVLRRLRALEELATRVAGGDLTARVDDSSPDELGVLARRLNHMTDRLRDARESLESADRQRRRLLADITHELATPLTSIRGFTETLLNPSVSLDASKRERHLHDVLEESQRMERLIDDLLDLTRLEAGAAQLAPVALDWTALCRNTVERYSERFAGRGLQLGFSTTADEAWVNADGQRFEQVIENLLVNAMRYVPSPGEVRVAIDAPQPGTYRLVVEDDGAGIPEADLAHVFDRFYRADPARASEGTGLGLAIVKEIVERHGGQILALRSELGGARFEIELAACR